jgi:UDP-N-acetylmuramoyl-L-alanyl-D-glutamate--2,6-diaminopimelate ligase
MARMTGALSAVALVDLVRAAGDLVEATDRGNTLVTGLAYDSRRVAAGDLFFCVPGFKDDGHLFAAGALDQGAAALCVQRRLDLDAPQVVVHDVRTAMGRMANEFFGRPAEQLLMLGITGTNGKTTTAYLLESILSAAGHSTGLIGTVETRVAGRTRPGVRTTPDSIDLHALLAEMHSARVSAVAMEVTSHGLALNRVEGVHFAAAAFTNLSQDHLDFHASMEDYFAAKRSLFVPERTSAAAINADDAHGRQLLEESRIPCLSFGLSDDAQLTARDHRSGPWGNEFVMSWIADGGERQEVKVSTPLVGIFNVSNCLAASATALQAGIAPEAIQSGIEALSAVPGRFEPVARGQPFGVAVDYAHTPDSLDNVLREARRVTRSAQGGPGRVICVFGCGGDRDRGKRPLMGAVAARLADVVVVTSDNPRSEDPQSIIDQILEGVIAERTDGADASIVDRRDAIAHAIAMAEPGDVVVIAGKGHETGQQFGDRTVPFDDRVVAAQALAELGYGSSG